MCLGVVASRWFSLTVCRRQRRQLPSDRIPMLVRAEIEGDVDPVGPAVFLSLAARQSVGTMSKHALGQEITLAARRTVPGMTGRKTRDFAGDVQVSHVPADASLDERRVVRGKDRRSTRALPRIRMD